MITHVDWQVRNSQRKYPVAEAASVTGDNDLLLPESLLVDANIWVPKYQYSLGRQLQYIWISSIMVSEQLVSMTLLGCVDVDSPEPEFVPVGSISLVKPVDPYRNYAIEPLLNGVMGWVAFGHFVVSGETISLGFSSPAQSLLASKAARFYDYLPIPSVQPYDGFSTVTGDVRIVAQAPVTAEIKDMRLYGESSDRRMLVLGLEQTEETLTGFAGDCGKRPESSNCTKAPITTIAGVAPDCTGNINIQFSPEIIVRYFSNPAYPVYDPVYPLRGGMCLDSVFSLDQACEKVRTLPDNSGLLPGEYTWQRPCDLQLPFNADLTDEDSLQQIVVLAGYVYLEDEELHVSAGMGQSAELAPCFATLALKDTFTVRTHRVTFTDVPKGAEVGMFAFDATNTRILFKVQRGTDDEPGKWSLSKFSKALNDNVEVMKSGSWDTDPISNVSITASSDLIVSVKVNDASLTSFTFLTVDAYYDPSGKAGVYVGGIDPLTFETKPSVVLGQYDVVDTYGI